MATQDPTTNYSWDLPANGDSGWGTTLNSIIGDDSTGIDAVVKAVSDVADAALPVAGGTMTGPLKTLEVNDTVVNQGSVSGAVTLDLETGNVFYMTTSGNITSITISNPPGSGTGAFVVIEITAGGSHTVTWGASYEWPSGSAPTQTVSGTDTYVVYTYDGGTTWRGARVIADVS